MDAITLTRAEAVALFDLIDELSGGNAGNVFAHDGKDSLDDALTSAAVKLFRAKGRERSLPDNLKASE